MCYNRSQMQKKYNEIKNLLHGVPVDLEGLCSHFSLTIRPVNDLPESISGIYSRKNQTITVNSHESKKRQRFTIGHGFGHYLLHKDQEKEFLLNSQLVFKNYGRETLEAKNLTLLNKLKERGFDISEMVSLPTKGKEFDSKEVEAEIFSSWLLMPFDLLADLPDSILRDEFQLAEIFNVPLEVVIMRMTQLHLTYDYRTRVALPFQEIKVPLKIDLVRFD